MKISIVSAFFQRQDLWNRTLETIHKSSIKDYEIILIDDASEIPLVCDEAKIIRIEPKDKWYHNPCIPFNMGFKEATGDIIIIQNPECMHMGDVLKYASENVHNGLYISFGCYAINQDETRSLAKLKPITIGNYMFSTKHRNGWYNHPIHRPVGYHFCSAITREDLDKVGGFDERYANGVAFDDDAFIREVKRKGISVQITTNPYVIHQFHTHFSYDDPNVWKPLHAINQSLYGST